MVLNDKDIIQILYFAKNYDVRLSWLLLIIVYKKLDDFLKELYNKKREDNTPLSTKDLNDVISKLLSGYALPRS
jgi:hypothetical protein